MVLTVSRTFAPISVVDRTVKPCGLVRARSGVRKPCSSTLRTLASMAAASASRPPEWRRIKRAGEDCAERIGEALAGDVGRGAVDRLIQIDLAADGGRGQHAERAGDDGGLVGENVAEEIFGEHDIVVARLVHQVHGHGVDVLVLDGDVGELGGDLVHRGAPELRDFKHVGLVDAGEFFAALLRELEGDAGHAGHFIAGVAHGVPGFACGLVPLAGLAEVEAAEQLADEENVGAVDDLGTQAGC